MDNAYRTYLDSLKKNERAYAIAVAATKLMPCDWSLQNVRKQMLLVPGLGNRLAIATRIAELLEDAK